MKKHRDYQNLQQGLIPIGKDEVTSSILVISSIRKALVFARNGGNQGFFCVKEKNKIFKKLPAFLFLG